MPGPQTPAASSSAVLPPVSGIPIVDNLGHFTLAGLNLFQQLWAGIFGSGNSVINQLPRPGDLKPIAGATVPGGWLLCDGAAYAQTLYPDLFIAIGTTWGVGGAGTFRVPPRGVFFFAADGPHPLGSTGGALSRTIAKANLPNYTLPNTLGWAQDTGTSDKNGETGASVAVTATGAVNVYPAANFGVQAITVTGHITGGVTSGGSGTALDTTPSYAAVNWLIKT